MSAEGSLGKRFRRGAFWAYLQGWVSAVVTFGGGIVMARLLEPEEFGLFAAVTAYTVVIGRQLQLGIPEALLRTPEEDMDSVHAAFWAMQALALCCAVLTAVAAPWLGALYGGEQYVWVMWAMAALFLLQPLCFAAQTELRRAMRHDLVARIALIGSLGSTVTAITGAASGAGVFSFVLGSLVSSVIMVVLSVKRSRWRPRPCWDWGRARALAGYGWRVHAANSLELAADRVDAVLIGRMLTLEALGIYRRADSTAKLPVTELLGRLYTLIFALFARLSGDAESSQRAFRKLGTAVLAPLFLALAWLWVSMTDFIGLLYGDKWLPAVPYARILVLAAMMMSLRGLLAMYFNASGHAGRQASIGLMDLALTVALVSFGVRWGLGGVAWAIVVRYSVLLAVSLVVVRRHTEIRISDFIAAVWPAVAATAGLVLLYVLGLMESVTGCCTDRFCALFVNGIVLTFCYLGFLFMLRKMVPENEGLATVFDLLHGLWGRLRTRMCGS